MKTQFIRAMILLSIIAVIYFLVACSLDTPQAPPSDNPWDPENPSAPRAPSHLSGVVLNEISMQIEWRDLSGNESGFIVEEGSGDFRPDLFWYPVDTVGANTDSLLLENRSPATEYCYRVLAVNPSGKSAPNDTVLSLNTVDCQPTSPTNLVVELIDGFRLKVSWQDRSANESLFHLGLSIDSINFFPEAVLPADSTYWISDSLDAFTTYYFRVNATNNFGATDFINSRAILPGDVPLGAPFEIIARALSETATRVDWQDTNRVAQSYLILESLNDTLHFNQVAEVNYNAGAWNFADRTPNAIYYYRVVAKNRFRMSPLSTIARAMTSEAVPWPPTNLTFQLVGELGVRHNWVDNSDIETGYIFEVIATGSHELIFSDTLPASTTTFIRENCAPFVLQTFRVCALNDYDKSDWATSNSFTPGGRPPMAPTDLVAIAINPTTIDLSWTDNSVLEESFDLFVRTTGNWTRTQALNANTSQFRLTNRTPNTSYTYRISATNRYGNSDYTTSNIVTTPGPPPSVATFGVLQVTPTSIHLQWTGDDAGRSGYILEDSLDGSDGFVSIDTIRSAAQHTYLVENPTRLIQHCFRLKSYNEWGESAGRVCYTMPYARVAYVACNDAGIVAVDVTDPENPAEIGRLDTPGLATRIDHESINIYLADSYGGLSSYDVRSPSRMSLIGTYDTPGRAYNVEVDDAYAYVAMGDSGVAILSVSSGSAPSPVGWFRTYPGQAQSTSILNNTLYVASADRGILKVNVSSKISPRLISETNTPSSSFDVVVDNRGSNIVTAEYAGGVRILALTDLAEVNTIQVMGMSYDLVQNESPYSEYFYLANFDRGVTVIHIVPPAVYEERGTLAMPDDTWSLGLLGTYLYAAVDNAGLKIIDISDPVNLTVVGTYQTPGPARGVVVVEYK